MNILVCIKQVPDVEKVKFCPETRTLIREGVENIMNPFDRHALEVALMLKDKVGAKVTCVSMGLPIAADVLKEAIAMGADNNQTIKAITEAEAYNGPSIIIAYAPCEMHSIKGGMVNCQAEMKKAVDCGYWNMFRYNPALKAQGKNPFTIDSKEAKTSYRDFLMNEARYSSLSRAFPERAEVLFAKAEETAKERYEHLVRLQALYAPKED